jgi:hypothetical protein
LRDGDAAWQDRRVQATRGFLGMVAALALGVGALGTSALAAQRTSASFYSPSRNISCEMNDGRPGVAGVVYCQSMMRPHSVKLGRDGRLRICRDQSITTTHCLGNPGEHTPVLAYGRQITVGHFRCRSAQAGITCTVISSGKGFRIDRAGVHAVGG